MFMYFAELSAIDLGALLGTVFGAFGTLLYGFYRYAEAREKDFEKSRANQANAFDKTIQKLTTSLEKVAASSNEVASATKQSAKEAKDRNGHLAEMIIQQGEQTQRLTENATEKIISAVHNVKVQHVEQQNVEHEVVKNKE